MSAAIDIVDIGTHIDLLAEVHGHCPFQLFFLVRATAGSGVHNVGVRDFCVVEIGVFRCRDIIIICIGKDEITCFLPFGEYFGLCRRAQVCQVADGKRFTFHQCRITEIQFIRIHRCYIRFTQKGSEPIGCNAFGFQSGTISNQQTVRYIFLR